MTNNMPQGDPLVSIRCTVYNHEPFLRQCLDGFVMQETTFPFEAIVHDDASTDGSAAIIREYAEKYPHIIKPIYETENQYSKHDGSLGRIMNEAIHPASKYIALCEGDDYWIDPHKLKMQVDFLEKHDSFTMCCCKTMIYDEKSQSYNENRFNLGKTGTISPRDIIERGGLFISTCSVVYRLDIKKPIYPDYCIKCHVGDYPLQIMCAMKGKVFCIDRVMSVYRTGHFGTWSSRQKLYSIEQVIKARKSEVNMLEGFAVDFPRYKQVFYDRIAYYINLGIPLSKSRDDIDKYLSAFKEDINHYDWKWRLHLRMRFVHNKYIQYLYYKISNSIFLNRFE